MIYRRFLAALVIASGIAFLQSRVAAQQSPTVPEPPDIKAAYELATKYNSWVTGKTLNARLSATWLEGNSRFWYRKELPFGAKQFVLVDASKGTREPAFDHKKLADALSKAAEEKYTADRLPFDSIEFAEKDRAIKVVAKNLQWRCDLLLYEVTKLGPAPREKPKTGGFKKRRTDSTDPDEEENLIEDEDDEDNPQQPPPNPPRFGQRPSEWNSPDGKWTVAIKDHNLILKSRTTDRVVPMTTNGKEGYAYTFASWSPDSKTLMSVRTEAAEQKKAYVINSVPQGQFRPTLDERNYRLPGDKLDTHEMSLLFVEDRKPVPVEFEKIDFGSVRPTWKKDNCAFFFTRTDRDYQRVRLIEVNAATGKSRVVYEEKSDTRFIRAKMHTTFVSDGVEIVWASEKDGWNHLYLIDGKTGAIKNQITRGEWVVRSVEQVDEKKREIWFTASGKNDKQDPHLLHQYRVNFDGSNLVALTEGDGSHTAAFSPDRKYVIDTYSRVDLPPVHELRGSDGKCIMELEKSDIGALAKTGWRAPEPFVAKGRDGKTDIWGVVFRPSYLRADKKYPIIENIYAGPWTASAPKSFRTASPQQALAELGFIVVQIDGMGLPTRSKAFHDASHQNHADAGLPDRMAWMKALAARYRYVDLDRVGIYGHSGGGYSSLRALLDYPDFFKVAVSSSGNHDPRGYDYSYTEQWMGLIGKHYEKQSNVTDAHKLKGKLLLMTGESDTNVYPSLHTWKVVDALIKADKDFDLLVLPGRNHAIDSPYVTRKRYDFFVKHLLGIDPPHRNAKEPEREVLPAPRERN
jgi:dipeptidyl aminopeptidase/acylaminoacyl peptidase